jgi:hypothetical protein
MTEDDEIKVIMNICNRVNPIIQRYLDGLLKDFGDTVTLSVVCNLAVGMGAQAMLIARARGGDEDHMLDVMHKETQERFKIFQSAFETQSVLEKAMSNPSCSPTKH